MRLHPCPACKRRTVTVSISRPDEYHCKLCPWAIRADDKPAVLALQALSAATPHSLEQSIYLTDEAWEWLKQTGHAYKYMRAAKNARNVNVFIAALSTLSYTDTRPLNLADTDQWWKGYNMPRRRGILVPDDVAQRFKALADLHGIAPRRSQKAIVYGLRARVGEYPDTYGPNAYVAAVVEAIGLRWLTPAEPIPAPPRRLWLTQPAVNPKGKRIWG